MKPSTSANPPYDPLRAPCMPTSGRGRRIRPRERLFRRARRAERTPASDRGSGAGYEPPMPTNSSTPFAQTSPQPARDIQEDAPDLAAVTPWLPGPPLQPRRGLTDQSLGKWPRFLMILRSWKFSDSIEFVV